MPPSTPPPPDTTTKEKSHNEEISKEDTSQEPPVEPQLPPLPCLVISEPVDLPDAEPILLNQPEESPAPPTECSDRPPPCFELFSAEIDDFAGSLSLQPSLDQDLFADIDTLQDRLAAHPAPLLPRAAQVYSLARALVNPENAFFPFRGAAICGPAGSGKSTLAQLLLTRMASTMIPDLHVSVLENAFPDGFCSASCSDASSSPLELQRKLARFLLLSSRFPPEELETISSKIATPKEDADAVLPPLLAQLSTRKRCLIFLEDVPSPAFLSCFQAIDSGCKFLVTTRWASVAATDSLPLHLHSPLFEPAESEAFLVGSFFLVKAAQTDGPVALRTDAPLFAAAAVAPAVSALLEESITQEWSHTSLALQLCHLLVASDSSEERYHVALIFAALFFPAPDASFDTKLAQLRQACFRSGGIPLVLASHLSDMQADSNAARPTLSAPPNLLGHEIALLHSLSPFQHLAIPQSVLEVIWKQIEPDFPLLPSIERLLDQSLLQRHQHAAPPFFSVSPLAPLYCPSAAAASPLPELIPALKAHYASNPAAIKLDGFYYISGLFLDAPKPDPLPPRPPEEPPVILDEGLPKIVPTGSASSMAPAETLGDQPNCTSSSAVLYASSVSSSASASTASADFNLAVLLCDTPRLQQLSFYQLAGLYLDAAFAQNSVPPNQTLQLTRAMFVAAPQSAGEGEWRACAKTLGGLFEREQLGYSGLGRALSLVLGCGWRHLDRLESTRWFDQGKGGCGDPLGAFYLASSYILEQKRALAMHFLQMAGGGGHAEAAMTLGSAYLRGVYHLAHNERSAHYWLARAAELGSTSAQVVMGTVYLEGKLGCERSTEEAARWYRRAAMLGYAEAQCCLSEHLERAGSAGVIEASFWLRKAARQGLLVAIEHLFEMHSAKRYPMMPEEIESYREQDNFRRSVGCPSPPPLPSPQPDESQLAEEGESSSKPSPPAASSPSQCGDKPAPKLPLGTSMMTTSFNIHIPEDAHSEFLQGKNYLYGGDGCEKNIALAATWFKKAAAKGHADSQFCLAECFTSGNADAIPFADVSPEADAIYWYKRAAKQDHALSQNSLAGAFMHGFGVAKNERKAIRWYRRSAALGLAGAQNNLAYALRHSTNPEIVNEKEAVVWFRKAAEQGHAAAQHNLGDAYLLGRGVDKDEAEAVFWYSKAAVQGIPQAQFCLGVAYWLGRGVKQERTELVIRWLLRAKVRGYPAAIDFVNDLKQKSPTESSTAFRFRMKMIQEQDKFCKAELLNEKNEGPAETPVAGLPGPKTAPKHNNNNNSSSSSNNASQPASRPSPNKRKGCKKKRN